MALWSSWLIKNKLEVGMKDELVVALKENFIEDTTSNLDPISNAWNYMFMKLDCCGVQPVISKTNDFDQTPWCTTSGSCRTSSSDIPRTCCTGVDESNYSSAPVSCHGNVTSGTYNEKGCYEALKEKLLSQSPTFVGLTIASLVLEIGAGIIAIVIYQYFRKEKMGSGILDRLENCCGIILNQSQGRINTGKRDVAP